MRTFNGTVFVRHFAQILQRILQSLRQCRITLATPVHIRMGESRPRQPEVIQLVIKLAAVNRDINLVHVGEVRYSHAPRLLTQAENHFLFRTILRSPGTNATLQGASHARVQFRIATYQFRIHTDRMQVRAILQHRHHLFIKYACQWIRPTTNAGDYGFLRWKPSILIDSATGIADESRFYSDFLNRMSLH